MAPGNWHICVNKGLTYLLLMYMLYFGWEVAVQQKPACYKVVNNRELRALDAISKAIYSRHKTPKYVRNHTLTTNNIARPSFILICTSDCLLTANWCI